MLLNRSEVPPLYALTARAPGRSSPDLVAELVEAGARWVQYREKELDDQLRFAEIERIASALPAFVRLVVNDRADLALACHADGVHLGGEDLPPRVVRSIAGENLVIGYSTHDLEEGIAAAQDPAVDYVAIGPIFRSATKNVRPPLGLEPIRKLRDATEKPVVAIGGIDRSNIRSVLEAGADSAAIIAALYAGGSIRDNVRELLGAAERKP